MEKVRNLNFCKLTFSDKDLLVEEQISLITKAYNINKEFFKIDIPEFNIKLAYSRDEFNRLSGQKETQDYVSAFANDEHMVIFSLSVFDKETRWKKEKFLEGLIHEINHLFYEEVRNDSYDPLWLSEGLATFMQHGKKKFNYKEKIIITKEILNQGFDEMTYYSYQVYTLFIEYLILNYSEEKIFKLIKNLSEGKEIGNIFQEVYGKTIEELIEDGNKYQKTI